MTHASDARPFKVRGRHEDAHHGRVVLEPSFEAAAVAYAEHMPHASDAGAAISLIVHDIQSGHEHCFRIDLSSGEAEPCG
jgi:hypothetical protein